MIAIVALIAELLVLVILKAVGITIDDTGTSFLILLFSLAFFATIQRNRHLQTYKLQLLLGYLLRIALLYFDLFGNQYYVLPNSGADTEMFYNGAVRYMNYGGWTRGSFPLIMGTLFRFIGSNRLYGQFLVMLLSIVSLCLLVYSIDELGLSRETSVKVIGITAFLPNLAILSSIFLRESLVAVFVTLSLFFFVLWIKRTQEQYFIAALVAVIPAAIFHSGAAGMFPGYLAIRLLYDKDTGTLRIRIVNILAAVVLAIGIGYILINNSDSVLAKFGSVDSIEDIANVNKSAGSSYVQYVGDSKSIRNIVIYTIPRIVYFLYSPFPWQWRGLADAIAFFFSSTFYIAVTWSILRCLLSRKNNKRRPIVVMLAMLIATTIFVFGWGVSNSGTAARHREKLTMLFAIAWALSSEGRPSWLHVKAGNTRIF